MRRDQAGRCGAAVRGWPRVILMLGGATCAAGPKRADRKSTFFISYLFASFDSSLEEVGPPSPMRGEEERPCRTLLRSHMDAVAQQSTFVLKAVGPGRPSLHASHAEVCADASRFSVRASGEPVRVKGLTHTHASLDLNTHSF